MTSFVPEEFTAGRKKVKPGKVHRSPPVRTRRASKS
jgi:hypothetical protein